jgi:hypothetical protein
MDTKSLYDAAVEADTLYRDDQDAMANDCILPWTIAMLANEDYLAEYFADFTNELVAGPKFETICRDMSRAAVDISILPTVVRESTIVLYASCLTGVIENIGRLTFENMRAECEKHVEANMYEWTADVIAYAGEVEEGQREDYAYENAKDRRLDDA